MDTIESLKAKLEASEKKYNELQNKYNELLNVSSNLKDSLSDFNKNRQGNISPVKTDNIIRAFSNEKLFNIIEEHINDVIWIVDCNFKLLYVSPSIEKLSGYDYDEYIRLPKEKRYTPRLLNYAKNTFKKAQDEFNAGKYDAKKTFTTETEYTRKDGSVVCIEVISSLLVIENQIKGIYSVSRDISTTKAAEKAKEEANMLLEESQSIAQIGGYILNVDSRKLKWTKEVFKIFNEDKKLNLDFRDILTRYFDTRQKSKIQLAYQRAIDIGENVKIEAKLVDKKGNDKWIKIIGQPIINNNRVVEIKGTIQDISEYKKIEIQLSESEEKFKKIYNHAFDAIVISDISTDLITDCNQKFINLTKYSSTELLKMKQVELTPRVLPISKEFIEKRIDNQLLEPFEHEIIDKLGNRIPVEISVSSFYWNGKNLCVSFIKNISDKKQSFEFYKKTFETYQLALDATEDGVFDFNFETMALEGSKRFAEILNLKSANIKTVDLKFLNIFDTKEQRQILLAYKSLLKGKIKHFYNEFKISFPDGKVKIIFIKSKVVARTKYDRPLRLVGVITDITQRKSNEENLMKTQRTLKGIIKWTESGIAFYSKNMKFEAYNPKMYEITGYSKEEVMLAGDFHDLLFDDSDFKYKLRKFKDYRDEKKNSVLEFDTTIITKNKETKVVLGKIKIVKYRGEDWFLCVFIDITKRKEIDERLKKSHKELQTKHEELNYHNKLISLISSLATNFINMPFDNIENEINETLKKIAIDLGFERSYLYIKEANANNLHLKNQWSQGKNDTISEYCKHINYDNHIDTMEKLIKHPFLVLDKNKFPNTEYFEKCIHAIGLEIVIIIPLIHKNNLLGIMGFGTTKQNIAFVKADYRTFEILGQMFVNVINGYSMWNNLSESEQLYRTLISTSPEAIIVINLNGIIEIANKRAAKLIGLGSPEKLTGSHYKSLFPKSEHERIKSFFLRITEEQQVVQFESRGQRPDGSIFEVDISAGLITDAHQTPKVVSIIAKDITGRKRTELAILESLKQEKELQAERKGFVSMINHEFNNPIATLNNDASQLVLFGENIKENNKQRIYNRMKSTVNELKLLMETVKTIYDDSKQLFINQPETVDFEDLCNSIILANYSISEEKVKIQKQINTQLGYIKIDPKLFRFIFTNMLSNAIKFTDKGLEIKVIIENFDDNRIKLTVEDKGIGIPKEELENIKLPYKRGSNVFNYRGTGLGMSIIDKCVYACNGTWTVKSEVNKGTSVEVVLPYEESMS